MRLLWFVGAVGGLLVAVVAWLVSSAVRNDTSMALPEGVEGIASHHLRWVEIGVHVRGPRTSWQRRPLFTETQGERRFEVDGIGFRVDDPMRQLKNWTIRSRRLETLADLPEAAGIPGWQKSAGSGGYYLSELVIDPGETLTLELTADGVPVALWRGGLDALHQQRDHIERRGASISRVLTVLGALSLLVSIYCSSRWFKAA